ncbi:MAG TPA: hypothetical protein VIL20_17075 [Sandaracinaceae bacterium]
MATTQAEPEDPKEAAARRTTRVGLALLLLMPVTIALTILVLSWLTASLR